MKHNNRKSARLRPGFVERLYLNLLPTGRVVKRTRWVRDPLGGVLLNPDDEENA